MTISRFLLTGFNLTANYFPKASSLNAFFTSLSYQSDFNLTGNCFRDAHVHLHLYATHETCRDTKYLSTYDFPERSAIGPPGGGRRDLSRSLPSPGPPFSSRDTGLRLISPRGKTSGTEFKFHKLVCPLHPRRNRDRLISPGRILRSSFLAPVADVPRGRFLESVGALSLFYSTLPNRAGQDRITIWMPTNHNAGAPQISPRDPRLGSSSRRDPSCFSRALLANPSWISRPDDRNATASPSSWMHDTSQDALLFDSEDLFKIFKIKTFKN